MTDNITHCDPAEGFCAECRQAAANKAAEEGGLPVQDLIAVLRECADALAYIAYNYDGSKLEGLDPRISESTCAAKTALIAERSARAAIEADRASRQVANKAEVEPACVCGSPTTLGSVHRADGPCYVAEVTPPATTGASTATGEDQWISRMQYDAEVDAWAIERDNLEAEIRSLKGSVGASTVLTDELSEFQPGQWWIEELSNLTTLAKPTADMVRAGAVARRFAKLVFEAREVAAQAGQVAVPEGFTIVPLEPTDAMMDAPEVKVGGCYSCSPEQVGWHDCAEIYRLMVAAAQLDGGQEGSAT